MVANLEKFALEAILAQRRDFKAKMMRRLLFASAKLFQICVKFRNWFLKPKFRN